ncbi:MAG: amidohydrolase [bacterium]|nr:amidohydrolase [bacterium]
MTAIEPSGRQPKQSDVLIIGRWLLSMSGQPDPIEYGAVAIQADRIIETGRADELEKKYQAREVFHLPHHLIMPGLVNAHTHAAMTLFRGLADDLPLMDWLQGYIFPAERKLSDSLVYAGTQLACLEMLLSGTTTFCDMYLFEKSAAQAARDMNMRAVVGEVLYDFPSPNYGPLEAGFRYTEELIQQWQGDSLIYPAVEPHSPYTCSPDLLKKSKELAEKYNVSFIIHLAETRQEVRLIQERYGKNPIQHLASLGVLDHQVLADHCIWLEEQDIELLKERKVRVAHMPESNMKLASGVAPVPRLLDQGITVGLGTDGCASNNNLDLFQEMDMAAKLHKVFTADPTVMGAKTVLEMATIGGARAFGLEDEIGSLEPGKKADIIAVDLNQPHLVPLYNIYSQLVYAARGADVDSVWINGELLVKERRPVKADLERILAQARELKEQVLRFLNQ